MKLITQPNAWSCTFAALAMVFDCTIKEIIDYVGHDGSEILNTLPEPACRKGLHIQEGIDVANVFGLSMTPIEAQPVQLNSEQHEFDLTKWGMFPTTEDRFRFYLDYNIGIIVGKARKHWHTVAWDGVIYDPQGRIYSLDDCKINIQTFWIVQSNH